MKKRKLFTALDSTENKVLVDSVDKESRGSYLCPYCKKEVVAKLGEKNVWHFAHKGEICEYLNIKSSDGSSDSKLDFSSVKTVDLDSVDLGMDSRQFLCVKCKKRFSKEHGLKWAGNEYVCRKCFQDM